MKVRELLDYLRTVRGDQRVVLRAPDGALGEVQGLEEEVEIEDLDGTWTEAGDEPTVGCDGFAARRATVFVIDGPVS